MPVDRTKKFLSFLASRGFVREEFVGDSQGYRIAKRGLEHLQTLIRMRKMFAALSEELPKITIVDISELQSVRVDNVGKSY